MKEEQKNIKKDEKEGEMKISYQNGIKNYQWIEG